LYVPTWFTNPHDNEYIGTQTEKSFLKDIKVKQEEDAEMMKKDGKRYTSNSLIG
jgi:hypothetical protein